MRWKKIEGGGAVTEPARFVVKKASTWFLDGYKIYDHEKFIGARRRLRDAKRVCEFIQGAEHKSFATIVTGDKP